VKEASSDKPNTARSLAPKRACLDLRLRVMAWQFSAGGNLNYVGALQKSPRPLLGSLDLLRETLAQVVPSRRTRLGHGHWARPRKRRTVGRNRNSPEPASATKNLFAGTLSRFRSASWCRTLQTVCKSQWTIRWFWWLHAWPARWTAEQGFNRKRKIPHGRLCRTHGVASLLGRGS
jgi:hypothetical protein